MNNEMETIVNSLPDEDTFLEDQRLLAMKLVNDELDTFPPNGDYFGHPPNYRERPFCTDLISNEHKALESRDLNQNNKLRHQGDSELKPAPSDNSSNRAEEWCRCVDMLKIRLEYRHRQLMNLELLKINGQTAWEHSMTQCKDMTTKLEQELNHLDAQIHKVRLVRPSDREEARKVIKTVNDQRNCLIKRIADLHEPC